MSRAKLPAQRRVWSRPVLKPDIVLMDPAITGAVLNRLRGLATPAGAIDEPNLSPQERRLLALVARGRTSREIVDALGLSPKTIKNYLSKIFQKIRVSRRAEAAAFFERRTR